MKVGIDTAAAYFPRYVLALQDLSTARGVDPAKYREGLGQHAMAVCPPDEDVVTLAANAAEPLLAQIDPSSVHALLLATESGIDQSKAAGLYVHRLLGLPDRCRVVEVKQACYSATAALRMAAAMVQPGQTILVIASDVARYGLGTPGEPSQGAGAVAMAIRCNPRLAVLEAEAGYVCDEVMDFWRPNYMDEALVDGKYSVDVYLRMLKTCWQRYRAVCDRGARDHDAHLFHAPVPRLAEKAYQTLMRCDGETKPSSEEVAAALQASLAYGRQVGNCYTASLYLGLLSLCDTCPDGSLAGQRLGLYSYGSGCVGEYFAMTLQPGYEAVLQRQHHRHLFATRTTVDVPTYEHLFSTRPPTNGDHVSFPRHLTGGFRLTGVREHQRCYERVLAS